MRKLRLSAAIAAVAFLIAGATIGVAQIYPGIFSCSAGQFINAFGLGGTPSCGAPFGGATTQGRLTLQSTVPVMTTSQTAKSTIFYDCYNGNQVVYFNGSTDASDTISGCEVSTALQSSSTGVINSGDVFDVWWLHTGVNRICVATNGAGGGWASDTGGSTTARGTGYSQLDRATRGYPTNKNSITHCYNGATDYGTISVNQATYLGSFASTAAGQTSYTFGGLASGGAAAQLDLFNYYNRVFVATSVNDSGATYTYTSGTIRQARASAGNQIQFVLGVQEDSITASYSQSVTTTGAANAGAAIGCGFDSTTTFATQKTLLLFGGANTNIFAISTPCSWMAGVGVHTLVALEGGDGTNANTFASIAPGGLLIAQIRQ